MILSLTHDLILSLTRSLPVFRLDDPATMSSGRTGSSQTSLTSQSDAVVTLGSPEKERPTLRVHLPTGCQLVKYSENTDVKVSRGCRSRRDAREHGNRLNMLYVGKESVTRDEWPMTTL